MISVILCGGSGARLWPLSRSQYPKQFLNLLSESSLLSSTIGRSAQSDHCYFVANEEHRFLVAEQKRRSNANGKILLEPIGRNTAPAIAIAALLASADGLENEAMVVMPSDHLIEDADRFNEALRTAEGYARDGLIVTLGVSPTRPETGYGYIKSGKPVFGSADISWIEQFSEKPDQTTAEAYVLSGDFYWNSGIYIITPATYLAQLKKHAPDVYLKAVEAFEGLTVDSDFIRVSPAAFEQIPSISIDHALMEPLCKYSNEAAVVIPYHSSWSDLGAWNSLWEVAEKDEAGNAVQGDVLLHGVKNSLLHSSGRLISAVGVEDLVLVETPDAVLIADKNSVLDVKNIVQWLEAENRSEYLHHREVYRPWGKYDLIGVGEGYQVKQITVSPGASLSLQKHSQRAEHWIVVKGCAEVLKGDSSFLVRENESTYIPIGEIHSLKNPTAEELVIIEVQSGSYLGEDDIERFDDLYGRD